VQGSHQVATVHSNNAAGIATVKVGDRVGSMWVINAGLKPGQRVAAVGVQKISAGMQVNPKPFTQNSETTGGK
jgi:membrane fusion protein, multidrug efflux system